MGLELKIKGITTIGEIKPNSLFLKNKEIFFKGRFTAFRVGDDYTADFYDSVQVFELEIKDYGNRYRSLSGEGD